LIQEGSVAVLRAAPCFDPERGYAFTTYAGDCIRRRIVRWLKLRRVAKLGGQELERDPGCNPLYGVLDRPPPPSDQQIADLLKQLPPLHRAIVRKRHGLEGGCGRVTDIGELLGLGPKEERRRYQAARAELFKEVGDEG
jgi:DNA-directed RNA polymerase sigma subunit (sigma70/sigma32)